MNDDFTKNNTDENGDPELIPCRRPARRPVRNVPSASAQSPTQNSDEIKIEKIPIEVLEKLLFENANPKIVEDVLQQKKQAEDEEKAKIEKARVEAAQRAKAEHERAVAAAEQARLAQARAAAAEQAKMEQARAAAEQAKTEQARAAAAEQAKMEQARAAAAEQAKMEQTRVAAEQARMEQARAAAAEQARMEQARAAAAEQARMEQARAAEPMSESSMQSTDAPSANPTDFHAPKEPANQIHEQQQEQSQEKISPIADTFDWIKSFLFSLTVVIFVFTLIFRGVTVNGDSMLPTLEDRNYLIISDLFYTPKTGDIVVVQSPNYKNASEPLIKRVIATGGQTVKINFNTWEIWVDGKLLMEDYILRDQATTMNCEDMKPDENGEVEIIVEKDCIFVMGDHRNDSLDSRSNSVGQIDEHYIMGRVLIRLTPLKQFGKVD